MPGPPADGVGDTAEGPPAVSDTPQTRVALEVLEDLQPLLVVGLDHSGLLLKEVLDLPTLCLEPHEDPVDTIVVRHPRRVDEETSGPLRSTGLG